MEYKIFLGTMISIKQGFMKGPFKLMYCGMPNENTFALSPFLAKGYQGFSPNIYYNLNSTVIQVFDKTFDVLEVAPEYVILGD